MMPTALILAAGRGTRMRSALPKVLHPLCGRPMLGWVLNAAQGAGLTPVVVVGHEAERVRAALPPGTPSPLQAETLGTGHAVLCAAGALPREGVIVVLAGDTPLLRAETLRRLLSGHGDAACTVLTGLIPEAEVTQSAYGRLVRDADGVAQRIVEAAEASAEERLIREFNSGVYCFDAAWLAQEVLPALKPHPPKGEFYLTDAVEAAAAAGRLRAVLHDGDNDELAGVNDRAALAWAEGRLRARINTAWMLSGVTMTDPNTTYIHHGVRLGEDVTLGPNVTLSGDTQIAAGATIGASCVLEACVVGAGVEVLPFTHAVGATLGAKSRVGPYARLREGTVLGEGVHVGNFVETKKATLHAGAKANHLSYLGDVEVGAKANIGAGTITCNYDGYAKHRTTIGAGAFIGSNSALVAPISIGAGALVAAGSTVVKDVPDDTLALARGPQVNHPGRAKELRAHLAGKAGKAP